MADADAVLAERGVDLLEPGLVEPGDEVVGAAGDLEKLGQRAHAVGRKVLGLEVLVELGLQAGHADLEELVQVRGADRHEPEPVEQRVGGVARFLEHPLVEVEPAQLAVDEQAGVERRSGGGRRHRGGWGSVELRVGRGHECNPHPVLPATAGSRSGREHRSTMD